MFSRDRSTNPGFLFTLGLIALAVAGIASYILQRKSGLSESVTDPVIGFAYGVAIATLLLAMYRRARASGRP